MWLFPRVLPVLRGVTPCPVPAPLAARRHRPERRQGGRPMVRRAVPPGPVPCSSARPGLGVRHVQHRQRATGQCCRLTQGIIGLVNQGRARSRPDEWGTLTAWTWGLSRAIDYFETDRDVDAKRLAWRAIRASAKPRCGPRPWINAGRSCMPVAPAKAARSSCAATSAKRPTISRVPLDGPQLPEIRRPLERPAVDAHELIALVAPRPVFVTGATQDPWADPRGEFLAAVAAGPVYRLLGKRDLGAAEMPAPDIA